MRYAAWSRGMSAIDGAGNDASTGAADAASGVKFVPQPLSKPATAPIAIILP